MRREFKTRLKTSESTFELARITIAGEMQYLSDQEKGLHLQQFNESPYCCIRHYGLDFKAFYEDKKIMHLRISKGLQVQREVVIHAGRVANVAANLMDLVSSKLKRENFVGISESRRPSKQNRQRRCNWHHKKVAFIGNYFITLQPGQWWSTLKRKHVRKNR